MSNKLMLAAALTGLAALGWVGTTQSLDAG